jgi:hypothetical protein
MDHRRARLVYEIAFAVCCAGVGECIAWVIDKIWILPEQIESALIVAPAIAAVCVCVDSRRKYKRYWSLYDELDQLDSTDVSPDKS